MALSPSSLDRNAFLSALNITADEEKSIDIFLAGANEMAALNGEPQVGLETAVKFLMARKFDVGRAIGLFEAYKALLNTLGMTNMDPKSLEKELLSGKFMYPGGRHQKDNSAIIVFTARRHNPKDSARVDVLRSAVFVLECAMRNFENQRNGITFIYNMQQSSWDNFDLGLGQGFLDALQDAFPARVANIYVLDAPWWFSAPLTVLKTFMKEKLAGKINLVRNITQFIDPAQLPVELGGTAGYDHRFWVTREIDLATKRLELPSPTPAAPAVEEPAAAAAPAVPAADKKPALPPRAPRPKPSYTKLEAIVDEKIATNEIIREFDAIPRDPGNPTFIHSKHPLNKTKNRYSNIMANDDSRVKLGVEEEYEDRTGKDYINGNYVDSFSKKGKFIATQGPLEATLADFWQMVFENRVHVIVMITDLFDRGRAKCHKYWPDYVDPAAAAAATPSIDELDKIKSDEANVVPEGEHDPNPEAWVSVSSSDHKGKRIQMDDDDKKPASDSSAPSASEEPHPVHVSLGETWYGDVLVKALSEAKFDCWIERTFNVSHKDSKQSWTVTQIQYTAWPDHGVPKRPEQVLSLIHLINELQRKAVEKHPKGDFAHPGPICIHCSAGIGRTGTVCASMYAIDKLDTACVLDVVGSVESVRRQRARMIETAEQYQCVYDVVLAHAKLVYDEEGADVAAGTESTA